MGYMSHSDYVKISDRKRQETPTLLTVIIVNTLDDGELASFGKLVGHRY